MAPPIALHRRQVFQSLVALSAVGALSACAADQDTPIEVETQGYFTAEELSLISALAETIIPATDTAGALEAEVPATLQALATDWGDDAFQLYWRDGLTALAGALATNEGGAFVDLSAADRTAALSRYDARVFAGEVEDPFFRDFKATVIEAYYTSETGATETLAYEPVPGEWIACAPLSDFPKTWAT